MCPHIDGIEEEVLDMRAAKTSCRKTDAVHDDQVDDSATGVLHRRRTAGAPVNQPGLGV